ncbi:MAG: arylsulfatase [Tannerella sp.]|jgi:arylsulfatase A-like enzyme|nr:arylsulfatase [Tannerella sp.]
MRNRTIFLALESLSLLGVSCHQEVTEMPSIIFILADDLGYGDMSYLNQRGKVKTPHFDRLAESGVVFTDAHSSSAVSTPTRYGILTGRYNWRSTLKQNVLGSYDKPLITPNRITLPEMLKRQGYRTGCIGKWHLGMDFSTTDGKEPVDNGQAYNIDFTKPLIGGPCDNGFDYYFGVNVPNYPPYCFIENRNTMDIPDTFYPANNEKDCRLGRGLQDWKLEEVLPALERKAVEFIHQSAGQDQPFFLYFPLTSPHTPIVPTSDFLDQSDLNIYADFVMQTDGVIGSIVKALEDNKITENTIVIFASDNGCSPRADFSFLKERGHHPSYIFKGMKADLFEGGHHIPCVVNWPAQLKHHVVEQTICLTDFMATFAAITGDALADNEGEDSYNILPLLTQPGYPETIREATVHHSIDGSFAIRQGKWKLLLASYSGGWSEPKTPQKDAPVYQLYDLVQDAGETNNLYESYPEVAEKLRLLLVRYVKEGRSTPGKPQNNDTENTWEQLNFF